MKLYEILNMTIGAYDIQLIEGYDNILYDEDNGQNNREAIINKYGQRDIIDIDFMPIVEVLCIYIRRV